MLSIFDRKKREIFGDELMCNADIRCLIHKRPSFTVRAYIKTKRMEYTTLNALVKC